jgi:hypothetical protein
MKHRHSIVLAAALAAAALIAAAAGAATLDRQATSPAPPAAHKQAAPSPRETTGSASAETFRTPVAAFQLHGVLGCAPAASPSLDCSKVEKLLAE